MLNVSLMRNLQNRVEHKIKVHPPVFDSFFQASAWLQVNLDKEDFELMEAAMGSSTEDIVELWLFDLFMKHGCFRPPKKECN